MVVDFTSILGLQKPDDTELARRWSDDPNIDDDLTVDAIGKYNDNLVRGLITNANTTAYAATLTATTTSPNLGADGESIGLYSRFPGDFIAGWFRFSFSGSGVDAGIGTYRFGLPFEADSVFHVVTTGGNNVFPTVGSIRTANANDATSARFGVLRWGAGPTHVVGYPENFSGKTTEVLTHSSPFTFQTGDTIVGNFFYKAVS